MTEIAFLVELALNGRLHKATRDKVLARIQECEQALMTVGPVRRTSPYGTTPAVLAQSPEPKMLQAASTQALLDKQAAEIEGAALPTPILPVRARIVGGEVTTGTTAGGSTKGPRKF